MRLRVTSDKVLFALFLGFLVFLAISPLGFVTFFGVVKITTLHLPVILGAIFLGKKYGALLGLTFGLISMLQNTLFVTPFSFLFSVLVSKNVSSVFLACVPRVALGYLAGWFFERLHQIEVGVRAALSGVLATFAHSLLVVIGIYLMFGEQFMGVMGISYQALPYYLAFMLVSNALLECCLSWGTVWFFRRLIIFRRPEKV